MEDKYHRGDQKYEEIKQLQKLVTKITKIKDLAMSYKKQAKILMLLVFGIIIFIVFTAIFLGPVFDNDNTFFKKHLVLSVFLYMFVGIGFLIPIVFIIIFECKIRKIYIHLNTAISSLYTNDIIDHEVQQNIEQYKLQIQMFLIHRYYGRQIIYIPKLSIAKIFFLQAKIDKLKRRQQRNQIRKHIN